MQGGDDMVPPTVDRDTPITNYYLTFDTLLPEPNLDSHTSNNTLPPSPDLSSYGDPHQWSPARKSVVLLLSCLATGATAYAAGAYAAPAELMATEFQTSHTAVLTGITAYTFGFGITPMILAPYSEINGRYWVFVASGVVFTIFQLVCGLVTNLVGMIFARLLSGAGGSVFSSVVGGVIADLWTKEERNTPMALFSGAVLVGTGLGPLVAGVMVQRWGGPNNVTIGPSAPWKWVFWHQAIFDGLLIVAIAACLRESRGNVLLRRKAQKLNQWYESLENQGVFGVWVTSEVTQQDFFQWDNKGSSPGDRANDMDVTMKRSASQMVVRSSRPERIRWVVKDDEQKTSLLTIISVSIIRPFHLLTTEPIVFLFSLWVSFAWAVLYLTFGSVPLVFKRQYGFNTEQSGLVFIAMIAGSIIATTAGIYQESLLKHPSWQRKDNRITSSHPQDSRFWAFLRRKFPVEAPESRLYFTCIAAILLPVGLYMIGFTSKPSIHWIVPAIAVSLATMGIFYIYLATFNYLADSYQTYASSALAAQSFCRNMLGGAFPLIVTPLFTNLGVAAACGLLGAIATALTAVPWILAFHGENIRKRSRFAVSLEFE